MPQTRGLNSTLLVFGYFVNRVAFPIASGMQYAAIYPALVLTLSLARFFRGTLYKFTAALALVMLVLIDARGMLFAPVFALLTFKHVAKLRPRAAALIAASIPAVPVLIYKARDISEPLVALLLPERNPSAAMFSNRGFIWEQYFSHLGRMDGFEVLFGSGGYGQYISGLNLLFIRFFQEFTGPGRLLAHMHNSYMQVLVDFGVFGLMLFCWLAYAIFHRAIRAYHACEGAAWLPLMLLTMQWIAGAEIVLTPYAREGFLVMTILWLGVAVGIPVPRRRRKLTRRVALV